MGERSLADDIDTVYEEEVQSLRGDPPAGFQGHVRELLL